MKTEAIMEGKKKELARLAEHFGNNLESYKRNKEKEASTRLDFIDKFFVLLDWDISNSQGHSSEYRDVVVEDTIEIDGKPKAPDYSFRIGGIRKFFVEAKKPSVDIKNDPAPALQVRRYAYTAKLPLSILTDFEEFAIYDTRIKTNKNDKASVARVFYCQYSEFLEKPKNSDYATNFEFIYHTFSKGAILKGSFNDYVVKNKSKKGTSEVDDAILELIEDWRYKLALNIALRNSDLTIEELNYVVQKIIDRIVFLRIAEDRGMEEYKKLFKLANATDIYQLFNDILKEADDKYNSGLFEINDLLLNLNVDDKILKPIFKSLYYPDCPYEFSVLGVEILGHIYEQFLGKTIRLTASHQAKVDDKPEVQKAGGVYYTPQYIVRYIVGNTVGKLIENKLPSQIEKIRILDPSCGSGSFLIGTYEKLLQYHLEYYTRQKNKEKALKNENIYQLSEDSYKLTIVEKKNILLNNVFGVDIDTQAVEVTKLSLLLKLLEGENQESTDRLFKETQLKVLPNLSSNIKSGNSLIDTSYFEQQDMSLFKDEQLRKINAFDWDIEFNGIVTSGGFDVIIGNPPWIDIKGLEKDIVKILFEKYYTVENRMNIYSVFIHKSLELLKEKGLLGFITPISFFTQSSYGKLRHLLLDNYNVINIIRLPDNVFKHVTAESSISIIKKSKYTINSRIEVCIYDPKKEIDVINFDESKKHHFINQSEIINSNDYVINLYITSAINEVLNKIKTNTVPLLKICDFSLGLTPYDKYRGHTQKQIKDKVFHSDEKLDQDYKPLLSGSNIERYCVGWDGKKYIKYGSWLGAPREQRFFTDERIIIRQIVSGNPLRIYASYSNEELYNTQIAFNLLLKEETGFDVNLKFILGILNSKLMNYYHGNKYLDLSKSVFQKILIENAKRFPIKIVGGENYRNLINGVSQIMDANKLFKNAKLESDKKMFQQKIDIIDNQINKIVYELYGLSDSDIELIEDSFKK